MLKYAIVVCLAAYVSAEAEAEADPALLYGAYGYGYPSAYGYAAHAGYGYAHAAYAGYPYAGVYGGRTTPTPVVPSIL
jgi:hypothetical protein